ncbi:MAG: DJ-1/PfpI family protein [Bacteroidaceae bacterium]|nr:DJ-1/PfpI family protein [Bacteroidaceae bacterium]
MIYAFLAPGFEEVEAIAPIDVCRRAGLDVKTVSITNSTTVLGAHGIPVVADTLFADNDYSDATLLFLPGGMPGATNLDAHEELRKVILAHNDAGKPLAAICAAPLVYGNLGLAQGKKMTCYPGFEQYLIGGTYTATLVERDGLMFTGKGPAAALALGYAIVEHFCGAGIADGLKQGMMYNDL